MKRTAIAVSGAGLAAVVLLGGAPAAQAHERHPSKEQRAEQRHHDRKAERHAARKAARSAHKPAQGATSGSQVSTGATAVGSPAADLVGRTRHVVSCAVTADRAGSSFTVHNGCDTPQSVTISVQSQPGPWHKGLCMAGGCHLLQRYDTVVQPGAHTLSIGSAACYYQVDLKWHGKLIRSNHFVTDCKPPVKPTPPPVHPKPRPPVVTPPAGVPTPITSGNKRHRHHADATPATLPRTGGIPWGETLAGLAFIGGGWTLRRLTRQPADQAEAWTEAQQ